MLKQVIDDLNNSMDFDRYDGRYECHFHLDDEKCKHSQVECEVRAHMLDDKPAICVQHKV